MTSREVARSVVVVFFGVSSSGKSTIARALSQRLGWEWLDADDLHPAANIAKMRAGIPLSEEDRWPWLRRLREELAKRSRRGKSVAVACSGLRAAYRAFLKEAGDVRFVLLDLDRDLTRKRIASRPGHFMNPTLLDSQFETLETGPPCDLVVDAGRRIAAIVEATIAGLSLQPDH